MRYLVIFFLVFTFSLSAQSEQDQAVFKNKVWRVVDVSNTKQSFFNEQDKYLGSREVFATQTIYKDKWKRTIKVIQTATVNQPPVEKIKRNSRKEDVNVRRANQVIVRRNKAWFYDENGKVTRTAKRRGRKVFFHQSDGKLIGYKVYRRDGSKIYKDARGRTTGSSHIDKSGRLIYRAKNRRLRTPRVLFEDPFLYSR